MVVFGDRLLGLVLQTGIGATTAESVDSEGSRPEICAGGGGTGARLWRDKCHKVWRVEKRSI